MFLWAICMTFLSFSLLSSNVQAAPTSNQDGFYDSVNLVVRAVAATSAQAGNSTIASSQNATKVAASLATSAPGVKITNNASSIAGSQGNTASATASARSAASSNTGTAARGNPQKSLTLDPRVIAKGFANDGQDVPAAGQVKSLTSINNFINFCLTVPNFPITNGKQITTGSCNPAPIGVIPSVDNMPSSKFTFPKNFATVKANTPFTIEMAIRKFQAGFFVNAQANYFAAPQFLNGQGQIKGHSHVVVELLSALDQTTPTDPKKFAFFKGLNAPAVNGKLRAAVTNGLPAGFYKLSSINSAANHQPVIVPVAQHGSLDDAVYFTVTADGKPLRGSAGAGAGANATATAVSSAAGKAGASSVAASSSASGKVAATVTSKAAVTAVSSAIAPATSAAAAAAISKAAATGTGKAAVTARSVAAE